MFSNNFIKLKSSNSIILLVLFSLPFVSLASSTAICDTLFWFIKISYYDFWLKLVERGPASPAIYDVVQSGLAVIITLAALRKLAVEYEIDISTVFKFGNFHWSFLPAVMLAPIIMAIPNFFARALFNLPLPTETLDQQPTYLLIFMFAVLIPIQEEAIWRGFGVSALKKLEISDRFIVLMISFGFLLAHLPSDIGILRPLAIMPTALILVWMRLKSGQLLWPILFHAVGNGVAVGTPLSKMIYVHLFGS